MNASSDLWGLGCVLYFMLTAHPPFQDKSEYLIFQRIRKLEYTIPDTMDAQAKHLIQSLLVRIWLKQFWLYNTVTENKSGRSVRFQTSRWYRKVEAASVFQGSSI